MIEKNLINELSPKGKNFLQIFVRFLKENNYFCKYKKAFEKCKVANKFDNLIVSCNRLSPHVVDNTIYWEGTDEGFDYWAEVNRQFRSFWSHIQKDNTLS